jgi:hypothetical protein
MRNTDGHKPALTMLVFELRCSVREAFDRLVLSIAESGQLGSAERHCGALTRGLS